MKEFKEIEAQLCLLEDRGLTIKDSAKAKNYLLTNNYYNIINGYSKFFQDDNDNYIEGSTFDEIAQLYFFDKEIKQTLFDSILDIEHHLKSLTAYRFAEAYPNKRYMYLDANVYDNEKILSVGFIISRLFKIINKKKRYHNNAISHYVENYDDVPIWVLVDFLDFGDLKTIIENLPTDIQNNIARDLTSFIISNDTEFSSTFTPETMISFIKNIHEVRNICAHNNRSLNFSCRADSAYFSSLYSRYNITAQQDRRSIYTTFLSMQCFLSKNEYAKLHNTLRKRFRQLSKKLESIEIDVILNLLGFPENWQNIEKLEQ